MRKIVLIILTTLFYASGYAQTAKDLFSSKDVKVTWLGVDFSHVKLIGDFSQFSGVGEQDIIQIRDEYFPVWNRLIVNERKKYDIRGMLRLERIVYFIDMINDINAKTNLKEMEAYNNPNYSENDIQKFVSAYTIEKEEGIGLVFVAESLNKSAEEGVFYFVAMNMKTKEILVAERLLGKPGGFGLRNYWAGSVYSVIKAIKKKHYRRWRKAYL